MKAEKLEHFRKLLLQQLREHNDHLRTDQATALDFSDDGVMDTPDLSVMDVNKELAFKLGEREYQLVADIDQALLRIEEGTYGTCARCGRVIEEKRLEVMPWVRYDAQCQSIIEQERGLNQSPSL